MNNDQNIIYHNKSKLIRLLNWKVFRAVERQYYQDQIIMIFVKVASNLTKSIPKSYNDLTV